MIGFELEKFTKISQKECHEIITCIGISPGDSFNYN